MNISPEVFNQLQGCKSIDEVQSKALELGYALTPERAEQIYSSLQFQVLDDDDADLIDAAGGCGWTKPSNPTCYYCQKGDQVTYLMYNSYTCKYVYHCSRCNREFALEPAKK